MPPFAKDALSYAPGDTVANRYRVAGVLGRGGFGAVYAGEHLGTQQPVAIKMLQADSSDPLAEQRFYREARITAKLSHPNTVRVFDVGRDQDGPLFLVMELLRGRTLEQVLQGLTALRRPMTELEAIEVGSAILRSLAEAHAAGLVHRDLKPANVMLHRVAGLPDQLKVLDFGCSHSADSNLTAQGAVVGTPSYMSPEQCMGDDIDARADLYALGVILFRCVTLRLPFEDTAILPLLYKHAHEPPPDPRTLAPLPMTDSFAELILRALAKDRQERFADAALMRRALEMQRSDALQAATQRDAAGAAIDDDSGAVLGRLIDLAETARQSGAISRMHAADESQVAMALSSQDGEPTTGATLTGESAPTRGEQPAAIEALLSESATRFEPALPRPLPVPTAVPARATVGGGRALLIGGVLAGMALLAAAGLLLLASAEAPKSEIPAISPASDKPAPNRDGAAAATAAPATAPAPAPVAAPAAVPAPAPAPAPALAVVPAPAAAAASREPARPAKSRPPAKAPAAKPADGERPTVKPKLVDD